MNETKPALNLPPVAWTNEFMLKDFDSIRWLGSNGAVRMGRLLREPDGCMRGVAFDELTHQVYFLAEGEYEPNVQKDANGEPVK